jgi:hypothetical protein
LFCDFFQRILFCVVEMGSFVDVENTSSCHFNNVAVGGRL